MKKLLIIVFFFVPIYLLSSPDRYDEIKYVSHSFDDKSVDIKCDFADIHIEATSESIIKVTLSDRVGKSIPSFSVIYEKPAINIIVEETADEIIISTDSINVNVEKRPLRIIFNTIDGKQIEQATSFFNFWGNKGTRFLIKEDEYIYGGSPKPIPINRIGYEYNMFNINRFGYVDGPASLNTNVPLYISSRNYGLFFDHSVQSLVGLGTIKPDWLQYNIVSGDYTYYFINGNNQKDILQKYLMLTGHQPMPPIWAFGYFQSKCYYISTDEVLNTMTQMHKEGYPVDVMVHDLSWFGTPFEMGNISWYSDYWDKPVEMTRTLNEMGIKSILITEPYVSTSSFNFENAYDSDYLATDKDGDIPFCTILQAEVALLDISKGETRDWLWSLYKKRMEEGISGWWCDMGEPDAHPPEIVYENGLTRDEFHNVYNLNWYQGIIDGWQKDYPDMRPFIMCRSGWAGVQRYSTFPLCGDAWRSYRTLKGQIPLMLSAGQCGIGYLHSDIGGYTGEIKMSPELYLRWMQFGAFSPIMRVHIAGPLPLAEPIHYPDSIKPALREIMNLRYRFLPYNYHLAYENSIEGLPLARTMNFVDTASPGNISYQYLWGDRVLVAPVYDSLAFERDVYFPEGKWVDYFNGDVFEGPDSIKVYAPLRKLPLYIKNGSILPLSHDILTTADYDPNSLILNIYCPDEPASDSCRIYQDDGLSANSYESGEYIFMKYRYELSNDSMDVFISKDGDGFDGEQDEKNYHIVLFSINFDVNSVYLNGQIMEKALDSVSAAGKENSFYYDKSTGNCIINIKFFGDDNHVSLSNIPVHNSITEKNKDTIQVMPNPSEGLFRVEIISASPRIFNLVITDINGQEIININKDIPAGKSFNNIDIRSYPAGHYFLIIKNGKEDKIYKLIKK